jgi:GNAT superfamily N-acetyltransferase
MPVEVKEILSSDTSLAFRAMAALRPELTNTSDFVHLVNEVQRPEGYRLVGVFGPDEPRAQAVAGFRVLNALAFGRYLYIDDLSTLATARRQGHGKRLLTWLYEEGRRLECAQVHLDSGTCPNRADAHRLYFNAGMIIRAYHFARVLQVP